MSIFQKSVINNHLSQLDKDQVEKAFAKFNDNYSFSKIAEIQKMKEEEYQDGFLRDIFVDVFGYTLKPADNYDLAREFKNQTDGKKADGAILKNENAIAVIELKSTKTKDLTKVTQQAFNYKNNQPECKYVITSNFQKLRFYIDYANEYEEFDLFNLQKEDFQLLYLLLQKDSILSDLPLKLKTETKFHEENISDKLYKDYSSFKYKIYNNLVKNNPQFDKLTLFKKSQKFLDRLLFVFFAEDTGLVPPNAISKIIEQWEQLQELEAYQPLYSRFVLFFKHLDKGHKYKTYDLPAYNGGLFAPDEILDNITIDDEVLKDDALLLSAYDYSTEVDVNILGHIFEHSLNEIEEITAEIEGIATEKSKTKRKKDGVFYTPKYITQYIVENTIGKLCTEKRQELEILEIEFDETIINKTGKISVKGKKLFETLQSYKDWLFSLKIVDPACGSGAFLNQALNFLINEHQQIDDIIAELTGEKLRLFDTDKTILEKNLYGVDINDESVEIAKLSLWLRTAQKGRKLSNLNNNIKCGNSLIDNPEVAGEKAFNWKNEFPEIFANGGFDVVIGNPPYVNINTLPQIHNYLKESYSEIHTGYNDLMYYFLHKGISILNKNGTFGVITSNYFIGNEYAQKLRGYLSKYICTLVNFNEYLIFEDANVHTTIILADKTIKIDKVAYYSYINDKNKLTSIDRKYFKEMSEVRKKLASSWIFSEKDNSKILDKLFKIETSLGDISIIEKGSTSGKNQVFTISDEEANQLNLEKKVLRLNVKNGDIHRYSIFNRKNYLIYTDNNTKIEEYPNILKYLEQSKAILENRNEVRKGSYQWWRMERPRKKEVFDYSEKIIVPYRATSNRFAYDNEQRFNDGGDIRVIVISNSDYSTKYVLSLLNSKLLDWFYGFIGKPKGKSREYFNEPLAKIPILNCENQQPFIEKVDQMLSLNKELQEKANRFHNRIKSNFQLEKTSTKLEKFYDFDFKTFVAELKKQKIKLSLVQQDEWEEYFNAYKAEINTLQNQLSATDKEIDQMVYELYSLTAVEIAIIENSIH